MSGFRPVFIKLRVREEDDALWVDFKKGKTALVIRATGYRDGADAEARIANSEVELKEAE